MPLSQFPVPLTRCRSEACRDCHPLLVRARHAHGPASTSPVGYPWRARLWLLTLSGRRPALTQTASAQARFRRSGELPATSRIDAPDYRQRRKGTIAKAGVQRRGSSMVAVRARPSPSSLPADIVGAAAASGPTQMNAVRKCLQLHPRPPLHTEQPGAPPPACRGEGPLLLVCETAVTARRRLEGPHRRSSLEGSDAPNTVCNQASRRHIGEPDSQRQSRRDECAVSRTAGVAMTNGRPRTPLSREHVATQFDQQVRRPPRQSFVYPRQARCPVCFEPDLYPTQNRPTRRAFVAASHIRCRATPGRRTKGPLRIMAIL